MKKGEYMLSDWILKRWGSGGVYAPVVEGSEVAIWGVDFVPFLDLVAIR